MAQDYNQEKKIDFDETFILVDRLEAIRLLLTFACFIDFKLLQMDVKSIFLNRYTTKKSICGTTF